MNRVGSIAVVAAVLLAMVQSRAVVAQSTDEAERVRQQARDSLRRDKQREIETARAKHALEGFLVSVQATSRLLAELETRTTEHERHLQELLTSDEGKRLAADPIGLMTYVRIGEEPRLALDEIRLRRRHADESLKRLQAELNGPGTGWLPDDRQREETRRLTAWTQGRLDAIERQQTWLAAALAREPKPIDLAKARTLQQALRDEQAREIASWVDSRSEGREQAREESKQVIRDTARMAELQKAQAESERLLKETRDRIESMQREYERTLTLRKQEEQRRQAEVELEYQNTVAKLQRTLSEAAAARHAEDAAVAIRTQKVISAADKKLLIQKCSDPDVRTVLAPFLSPGYTQPGSFTQVPQKQPISLSKLRAFGALEPDRDGFVHLIQVATHFSDKTRPRWSCSPNFDRLSAEQIEMVRRAQNYLSELGEVMVEQGMLAP